MKILEITGEEWYDDAPMIHPMSVLYHITPHSRTNRIRREGLVTGKRSQWHNVFGAQLGQRNKIYLFSDLDAAIQLGSRMEWYTKKPVDILQISPEGINLEPDPHMESQSRPGTWWMTSQPIPPGAIQKVIPITLELKRNFVARKAQR